MADAHTETTEYDTVTCHACDGGAGCMYCNKTGSVEVKKPATLCPKCGGRLLYLLRVYRMGKSPPWKI
ncbi:hypothetical protein [Methanogenium cariaci]|uniref:hypothetical protein n=1 Tax=Methanogenium cariaci TaxID=2197 RepID=UPI001FE1EDED|nr:hypothetical protein [Methanogenium cariaci]